MEQENAWLRAENGRLQKELGYGHERLAHAKTAHSTMLRDLGTLQRKYDSAKLSLQAALWENLADTPAYASIPPMDPALKIRKEVTAAPKALGGNLVRHVIGDRLVIREMAGQGRFASVYKGLLKIGAASGAASRDVAVKMIEKARVRSVGGLRNVDREVSAMRELADCEYIVHLLHLTHGPRHLCLVLELGDMDLYTYGGKFPSGVPRQSLGLIALSLLRALSFMHVRGLCHRDIKPENVLINFAPGLGDGDGDEGRFAALRLASVRVCDFGIATPYEMGKPSKHFCGSPGFFAPEMLGDAGYTDPSKLDVWSFGCVLLEISGGHHIFKSEWMPCYAQDLMNKNAEAERGAKLTAATGAALCAIERACDSDDGPCYHSTLPAVLANALSLDPGVRRSATELLKIEFCQDAARNSPSTARRRIVRAGGGSYLTLSSAAGGGNDDDIAMSQSSGEGSSAAAERRLSADGAEAIGADFVETRLCEAREMGTPVWCGRSLGSSALDASILEGPAKGDDEPTPPARTSGGPLPPLGVVGLGSGNAQHVGLDGLLRPERPVSAGGTSRRDRACVVTHVRYTDLLGPSFRRRVLVVDDDPLTLKMLANALRKLANGDGELQVDLASGPVQALKLLAERPYELVFTDLYMPSHGVGNVPDGEDLLKTMHAMRLDGASPFSAYVCLITGCDQESYAPLRGFYDFVEEKPLNVQRLARMAREIGVGAGRKGSR